MFEAAGQLLSFSTEIDVVTAQLLPRYLMDLSGEPICLNDCLGSGMTLTFSGQLNCLECDKKVRKLYSSGYCYDCSNELARCDLCIMSPERCHYHLGTCREPAWGEDFCMQPHTVYVANTSGPKVGITRQGREHRRWTDQGASEAMAIVSTPSRRAAGVVEDALRRYVSDRTDWRKLVSGTGKGVDLVELSQQLRREAGDLEGLAERHDNVSAQEMAQAAWIQDQQRVSIRYPQLNFAPAHRYVLNGDTPQICDNLCGVVGQYLLMDHGVLNLSDYRGATLHVEIGATVERIPQPGTDQLTLF